MWVASLKGRKAITITNAFQETLHACGCKPNKIWTDKSSEFYNRSRKYWLQENDIEMESKDNEGKSVVVERFIRT